MNNYSCDCPLCVKECKCHSYAKLFSVLGNQNRQHILTALQQGPKNVGEIQELTRLEQTCISHCLSLLEQHGFVTKQAQGKYRVYRLTEHIKPLLKAIDTFMEERT